jgi:DNA-binding NarL/FixJ family response regulator
MLFAKHVRAYISAVRMGHLLMEKPNRIPERARVVLIDESKFVLEGLQAALSKSSRIFVAETARTEQEVVVLIRTCQSDVVILDVRAGRASGITLCGVIRESYPNNAVLFFTADDDRHTLQSAILAGAQSYVLRGASEESIVKSVEIVAGG